jgi:hypothetical protein
VNSFNDNVQIVTTNNYYILADSHTTNHSTVNLLSAPSLVFTIRFLATDFNTGTNISPTKLHTPNITVLQQM